MLKALQGEPASLTITSRSVMLREIPSTSFCWYSGLSWAPSWGCILSLLFFRRKIKGQIHDAVEVLTLLVAGEGGKTYDTLQETVEFHLYATLLTVSPRFRDLWLT